MAVMKHGRQSSSRIIPAIPRALGPQRREKQEAREAVPLLVQKDEQVPGPALHTEHPDGKELTAGAAELPTVSTPVPDDSLNQVSSPVDSGLRADGDASTPGTLEAIEAGIKVSPAEHVKSKP